MELTREILDELKEPFPAVKWRAGATHGDQALAFAYIESRDVMDRLDEVLGSEWEFHCDPCADSVRGSLTVCGITRQDFGEAGDGEYQSRKSAASDSLKRCAVHFGIGRYLYRFPKQWIDYDGKKFTKPPQVPEWAIPKHDPKTGLDEFVKRAAGYYENITANQIRKIIGNVEWTGDNEQRKEIHAKLRAQNTKTEKADVS